MNPCRKNVSAAPAIVKTKKANGISQYLLRFRVLLARTATTRKRAVSPSRKAPWKIHRDINATPNRNDKPATKQNPTSTAREIGLGNSLPGWTLAFKIVHLKTSRVDVRPAESFAHGVAAIITVMILKLLY